MKKINIKEEYRIFLPANQIFWGTNDFEDSISPLTRLFSVTLYNTTECPASRFYKPISRIFEIRNLLKR